MLFDLARTHPGVAVHFLVGTKPDVLLLPGALNAVANRIGNFFGSCARNIAILDGGDFDMEIDPVEQRPGDSLAITLDLDRTATAFALQVAEVSAGTRIHSRDEHELRWESHATGGARDSYFSIFEWLPHHLEGGAFELRQLIEKQNAVVGKAHLTRLGNGGAAKQADIGDGVMWRTKRPGRDESLLATQHAGNAVDLRALDRFLERHRRHDSSDP